MKLNFRTRVNDNLISEETLLQHGDRIEMGINHIFQMNYPISPIEKISPIFGQKEN